MRQVILQVELEPQDASIKGVRRKLGLKTRQVDREFGVRPVRPERNLYAVRVDADVAQKARGEDRRDAGPPGRARDVRVTLVH